MSRLLAWTCVAACLSLTFPCAARAQAVGSELLVNAATFGNQTDPDVAVQPGGDFVVVWQGPDGSGNGVFARRGSLASGTLQGGQFQVNVATANEQLLPGVGRAADGSFVVVWASYNAGSTDSEVMARRFDAAGSPVSGDFLVNSFTTGRQAEPDVAVKPDGSFVVVWRSDGQDGSLGGIFGQRYDANGNPQGVEFPINSYWTASQSAPRVAANATGDFIAVWQSNGQDGSGQGVYAQRFAAGGGAVGSEFRVNATTAGNQFEPSTGLDDSGQAAITWTRAQGVNLNVFARRFNAANTPLTGEFRVNSYTTNDQYASEVAMNGDGSFVVAWHSEGQDGGSFGIFGQRYRSDGQAIGPEFQVTEVADPQQRVPAVAAIGNATFVVAWQSLPSDGNGYGIVLRRYDLVFEDGFNPVP